MTVKIASNGDLQAEMKGKGPGQVSGRRYYFVGGKDYLVDPTDAGSVVMRLEDIGSVLTEQAANTGLPSFNPPPVTLVRRGTVSINKWSGDAYYMQAPNGQVSSRPVVIISHDPSLTQLGKAMARQFATSEIVVNQLTSGHGPKSNMGQILSSGAPISFAGAELKSVSFAAIPEREFVLPDQPAPLDQVRRRMTATSQRFSVRLPEGQTPTVPCHVVLGG